MCGIVGAVAQYNVAPFLLEGLHQLEYRGYDSAGLAVLSPESSTVQLYRAAGKVENLAALVEQAQPSGLVGIAHTRWATHGEPTEENAHPQVSHDRIAVVHNGIIENHRDLRAQLESQGYVFSSQTDTEVVAHLIHLHRQSADDLATAVRGACEELKGIFALAVVDQDNVDQMVVVCQGSPLVLGMGPQGVFAASDQLVLNAVADQLVYLKNGDLAQLHSDQWNVFDLSGAPVERKAYPVDRAQVAPGLDGYRHYMHKEMHEQPDALRALLGSVLGKNGQLELGQFPDGLMQAFEQAQCIQIVACGSSYYASLASQYWFEALTGLPCHVEVASEYRYRKSVVQPNTLFITVSQSGETADTISALNLAKTLPYLGSLAICNVTKSSLGRGSDWVMPLHSGPEIGVASTKAFTSQLLALLLVALAVSEQRGGPQGEVAGILADLSKLPASIQAGLDLEPQIQALAKRVMDRPGALYIGRGLVYPIALEGALKLKEISYMLAQAYPAGELKHGPLALVDCHMPVIALAPDDVLSEKMASNIEEVMARGGRLSVFADADFSLDQDARLAVIKMPKINTWLSPILYTIPLQLLAYHVALLRGHDVDQPRNLAKSVTVE